MEPADVYLKWVEWSEEDGVYIGRCPELFYGGCHGSDPVAVYAELCEIVAETVASLELDAARTCIPPHDARLAIPGVPA